MKVSGIRIKDFQQFKDFELDLTYPEGHAKAGEPLDRICFIGQSGTGKTILLELLKDASFTGFSHNKVNRVIGEYPLRVDIKHKGFHFIHSLGKNGIKGTATSKKNKGEKPNFNWDKEKRTVIYFPFGINALTKHLDKDLQNNINNILNKDIETKDQTKTKDFFAHETYYEFDYEMIISTWQVIYKVFTEYQNKEADFRLKATRRLESKNFDFKAALKNWRSENPNPLVDIAKDCLDKILNQIHLKVKTDIDSLDELNSIQIERLDGTKTIKYEQLSTGTRQFIFTALPLYLIENEDSIILIDEPETSLYPDIQRQIVPTYTDLAPKAQFFYATHSPVILSSFEPWEIVVLEFDEDGFTQQKKMYKGQRHIDNYVANPKYLRWDDILMTYLGLDEEGGEERIETLNELAIINNKLKHLNGGNEELKKELLAKHQAKAEKLNWNID